MARMLIALGGNALGKNVDEQKSAIQQVVPVLANLIEDGHELIISHGNGPQVGMIHLAFIDHYAAADSEDMMPFPECNAMSEGYIGFHLQNAITNELMRREIHKTACTIVTQVVVDANDPAFKNHSKPIGKFYNLEEANDIAEKYGYIMKEDAGRGYRRVVPSPKPIDIVEKQQINELFSNGHIVIACGGGGVPVISDKDGYRGVDAVIDKDFAGSLLAELVEADYLIILTAVTEVFINFGKSNQTALKVVTPTELTKHIQNQQFSAGSMLPKVEAAIRFVNAREDNQALITSIESLGEALAHRSVGTFIRKGDI